MTEVTEGESQWHGQLWRLLCLATAVIGPLLPVHTGCDGRAVDAQSAAEATTAKM